nr:formin-like protein 14 [Lolium perenne]
MARSPFPQPPLLPLPAHLHQASPPPPQQQRQSRPAPARSPRKPAPASAPIVVVPSPSKKRATGQADVPGFTSMEYPMCSVSPPPSSVPMPTSLLLPASAGRKKAPPTACAVQVASAGAGAVGGVDVGATDELRRLLRL